MDDPHTFDPVAWARRVNQRWLVHHGLGRNAAEYLDDLALADPDRLLQSCRNARELARRPMSAEDPKPWFYAGLFSLATPAEAQKHLANHWFTVSVLPAVAGMQESISAPEDVGEATKEKILKIRAAVEALKSSE